MGILSRFFSKSSADLMAQGDRCFTSDRHHEARNLYTDALNRFLEREGGAESDETALRCRARIAQTGRTLAGMNLCEAEYSLNAKQYSKASEHCELALSLSDDTTVREKAESLRRMIEEITNDKSRLESTGDGCSCNCNPYDDQSESAVDVADMPIADYFDLLVHQLPSEICKRYAGLGEDFACLYVLSHRECFDEALQRLDTWQGRADNQDVYLYEKGMILYHIGHSADAERDLAASRIANPANPLPHLGLAQLMIEQGRLEDAGSILDGMITDELLPEQAIMLRGDVHQLSGDIEKATSSYARLLATGSSRHAAERLYVMFSDVGRQEEAAALFKQYLGKGCR